MSRKTKLNVNYMNTQEEKGKKGNFSALVFNFLCYFTAKNNILA